MWVRVNERETINVDSEVVKLLKEDIQVQSQTYYYIGFYNSLDIKAKAAYQYKFDTESGRNNAFESINSQLETIDIRREK